jgi:hypothetical protein
VNNWFLAAGVLTTFIALAHSVVGEWMIFRHALWHQRQAQSDAAGRFLLRRSGILWATWHVTTVFGLLHAAFLIEIGRGAIALSLMRGGVAALALGFGLAGLLVGVATKGRHPGGLGLLLASGLVGLGLYA